MDGIRLATIFSNIAEVYKRTQARGIVFKLNVAARTIRDYPDLLEDKYREGRLKEMEGIDDFIADMISEYIEKGTTTLYEKIKSNYTEELIRFIRMSGLGSTRMFALYEKFGIDTTEKLKTVLSDNKVIEKARSLGIDRDGLNDVHLERLRHTIAFYEATHKLVARGYIERFLPRIKRTLTDSIDLEKVMTVGSYRRKRPYLNDLDILILPKFNLKGFDPSKSRKALEEVSRLDTFESLEGVKQKDSNLSGFFKTKYGFNIELIITSGPGWIVDLFTTTGSVGHVSAIKKLNSDIFSEAYRDRFDSEEGLYRVLGLDYITPELREEDDIIKLAAEKKLPRLIELEDIKGDLHIHSHYSDGRIPRDVLVEKTKRFGYEYIALSDHSMSNRYGNGLDGKRLEAKMDDIRDFNNKVSGLEIMVGSEVDIKSKERLDYPQELLSRLDIVIASMHSSYTNSREENTSRVLGALDNPLVDIIAHPTGVVFGNRAPYVLDIDKIFKQAATKGKALEINSYYLRLDLDEAKVKKAKKAGVPIVINTDSHRPNNIDMIRLGVDIARRARLEKQDVVNTKGLEEFIYWKENR